MTAGQLLEALSKKPWASEVLISIPNGQRGGDYEVQQSNGKAAFTQYPDGGPILLHIGRLKAPQL